VKYAIAQAGSPSNIKSGFANAGLYPFNRRLFTESDFEMSKTKEQADPTENVKHAIPNVPVENVVSPTVPIEDCESASEDDDPMLADNQNQDVNDVTPEMSYQGVRIVLLCLLILKDTLMLNPKLQRRSQDARGSV